MKTSPRYRWFVVAIFFTFMLLHQSDKLLIGPLTGDIMDHFGLDSNAKMGAAISGALIVGAVFYPIWGYLYDRFIRSKLVAAASFIWGATTWLSAIAPTFGIFVATRASTGIDDSSYPGLFSLISDYFEPNLRGKVYGILQLTAPIGYLVGMLLALGFRETLGWQGIFVVTGTMGLVLAIVIFFGVKEAPRGKAEPELADIEVTTNYKINKKVALALFKKKSLRLLFLQGFLGVFPWNVITYWIFKYMEEERFYTEGDQMMAMVPAVLVMAAGYFVGGALGDKFFKKNPKGRIYVAMFGVLAGAIMLFITIMVPVENKMLFLVLLSFTALFMPFASPNVISTVYDITVPEVRSTALAIQYFIESSGAALAPWLAGLLADTYDFKTAILGICVTAWLLGGVVLGVTAIKLPKDVKDLREEMQARADHEKELQDGAAA